MSKKFNTIKFDTLIKPYYEQNKSISEVVKDISHLYPNMTYSVLYGKVRWSFSRLSGGDTKIPKKIKNKKEIDSVKTINNKTKVSTSEINVERDALEKCKTADDLLKLHGFNPSEFELVTATEKNWEAQATENGEVVIKQMSSSSISAKPRKNQAADEFYELVQKYHKIYKNQKKIEEIIPIAGKGDKVMIVPIADFHLDKREPGISYLSFEKQVQRFHKIMEKSYSLARDMGQSLGKIVFFWSQDFFNYDYMDETTTSRKNKQDSQVGYKTMVPQGVAMLITAIRNLEKYAPVEIIYCRSNHDEHTAYNTMLNLYCTFMADPNIIIDGHTSEERIQIWDRMITSQYEAKPYNELFDTAPRKYIKWGDCLFGFAHGDKEGKRISYLMQTESNAQMCRRYAHANNIDWQEGMNPNLLPYFEDKFCWDTTSIHVFFLGHFHSKRLVDENGVECINLGTDMTSDDWHRDSGYVGAQRKTEIYVYSKNGDCSIHSFQSKNL